MLQECYTSKTNINWFSSNIILWICDEDMFNPQSQNWARGVSSFPICPATSYGALVWMTILQKDTTTSQDAQPWSLLQLLMFPGHDEHRWLKHVPDIQEIFSSLVGTPIVIHNVTDGAHLHNTDSSWLGSFEALQCVSHYLKIFKCHRGGGLKEL